MRDEPSSSFLHFGDQLVIRIVNPSEGVPRQIQERWLGGFQLECVLQDPPTLLHDILECLVGAVISGSRGRLTTHSNLGCILIMVQEG